MTMDNRPGRILTMREAECGLCQDHSEPLRGTRQRVEQTLRETGWRKTRLYGWVHAECLWRKVGR